MEGAWRVVARLGAIGAACVALAAAGCDSGDETDSATGAEGRTAASKGVSTDEPEKTFAPLVLLHPEETRMPADARWFLERTRLNFAEDHGCPDRRIAVGRTLGEERTDRTNWIAIEWLGNPPAYWRNPYDVHCELDFDREYYATQHTRPYGGPDRAGQIGEREGWYLDLVDSARSGEARPARAGHRTMLEGVPAYVERHAEPVDGEPGLHLTYWMLYAMNEPRDRDGAVERELTHEGDWERAEVLLRRAGRDSYVPHALVLHADGETRELSWRSLVHAGEGDGKETTHAVLLAALGDHTMAALTRERDCSDCPRWQTWEGLQDVREPWWYGFGGAWGDVGVDEATTGPLGPHGEWPSAAEAAER
jgi:hypothetical protein